MAAACAVVVAVAVAAPTVAFRTAVMAAVGEAAVAVAVRGRRRVAPERVAVWAVAVPVVVGALVWLR